MSLLMRLVESRRSNAVTEITDDAVPRPSFYVLVLLSTAIASYGLLANSTAVVIGAMLIAPLMGPIYGIALGLIRDERRLFFMACLSEAAGVLLVVSLALLIGLLPLRPDFGSEILSRTRPNLYDLLVAIVAGLAGGYARVSERVSPTLPGVAIATALVPPLAACGLCLSDGRWDFGAFLLFITNLLAIEISAGIVFVIAGLAKTPGMGHRDASALLKRFVVPIALLIPISVFLANTLLTLVRDDRLTKNLRTVLSEDLRSVIGADVNEVRHNRRGDTLDVVAIVLTPQTIEPALVTTVENDLRRRVDASAHLIVRSLISRDADRAGQVFLEDAARSRLKAESQQRSFLAAASNGLRESLRAVPGADLIDVQRDDRESNRVRATVRSPVVIDPSRVSAMQTAVSTSAGMPIRLVVRSVLTKDADQHTYLDEDPRSVLEQQGRAALGRALDQVLPDAELLSVRLNSNEPLDFVATIGSIRSLDTRMIRTLQSGLSDAVGRPAALTVRTIALRSRRLPTRPTTVARAVATN
jgi:uncharacterized hydrophobic protein (TIGR00271 family)